MGEEIEIWSPTEMTILQDAFIWIKAVNEIAKS